MKLKVGSKEKEKKFLEKLEGLFEDPLQIIPECEDKGFLCPFESYRKKVGSVAQTGKYDKFSRSADQFLSGISETYKILESNSAPILGFISTPYGNVEYGKRGNTDETVLAGIQNYDNEVWRMLAFTSLTKSGSIKVYSSKNYYIASCKGKGPGIEFFEDVLNGHGIPYSKESETLIVGDSGKYILIDHFSGVTIKVFENAHGNTLHMILKHFLTRDVFSDFEISSPFIEDHVRDIPGDALREYFTGKADNKKLIRSIVHFRTQEAVRRKLFVIGDNCYSDVDEFLGKFKEEEFDLSTLKGPLQSMDKGVSLDSESLRKLLEILWPSYRDDIMGHLFPDMDSKTMKSLKGNPMDQIESARRFYRTEEVEKAFTLEPWSKNAEYLISIVKDYFKSGKAESIRNAEKGSQISSITKSIFYSFLVSLGETYNKEWQFSDHERDLGSKIQGFMDRIIKGETEDINEEILAMKPYVP